MDVDKVLDNESYFNRNIHAFLRISFVVLLIYLSYFVLKPFLLIITWSIIIAVSIYPLHQKLVKVLKGKEKLSATLITLLGVALIVIPSIFLLGQTLDNVENLKEKYQAGEQLIPPPAEKVAEWPVIGKTVYKTWEEASTNIDAAIKTFEPQLKAFMPKFIHMLTGLGGLVLLTLVAIIIAGVLLVEVEPSEKVTQKIFYYLIGQNGKEFTTLVVLTIRSVVQGILAIAITQAVLAGLLMVFYGVPGAGLWALLVLFLAIMQLPPSIVMLPVAIYMFSVLSTTQAIIFLILAMIVAVADAVLKPIFLGRGVDVPMLVVLLGAIGGMIVMGLLGLFIGAVVLAVAYKVFVAMIMED